MKVRSLLLRTSVAAAPLLVTLAPVGAWTARAAASTVIVATTDAPTDCGNFHRAVTDLSAALSAAHGGKVLICPGTYELLGGTVVTDAKSLTIGQAVKGVPPQIMIDPSATVGLEIRDSRGVTLDGLILDATSNDQVLVMLQFAQSAGQVRNTTLIGSATTATGILVDDLDGTKQLKLAIKDSEVLGYQNFGVNAAGPIKLSVTSSLFDGSDAGRIRTDIAVGVVFDGSVADVATPTPTGSVTKSTLRDDEIGVRIRDGSRVTISGSTLIDNDLAVEIEGGITHALSKNNRIVRNTIAHCNTCIFIDDEADDPQHFQLLNTVISNNVFHADDSMDTAVDFRPLEPAVDSVTGTVTGNTFIGYLNDSHVLFNNHDFAGVKFGKNTVTEPPALADSR